MKPTLHVQVTEFVMGWRRVINNTRGSGKYWWVEPGRKGLCLGNPYSQPVRPNQHWNPTKDANHALEVLEKMWGLGYLVSISKSAGLGEWEVTIDNTHMDRVTEYAPTLPIAICRAAVKALSP